MILDIRRIKGYLSERCQALEQDLVKKNFLVLEDLNCPVRLVNSHAITAKSIKLIEPFTNESVAREIYIQNDWISFYTYDEVHNVLR